MTDEERKLRQKLPDHQRAAVTFIDMQLDHIADQAVRLRAARDLLLGLSAEPKIEPKIEPRIEPRIEPKAEPKTEPKAESRAGLLDRAVEYASEQGSITATQVRDHLKVSIGTAYSLLKRNEFVKIDGTYPAKYEVSHVRQGEVRVS